MKITNSLLVLTLLLIASAIPVRADIARPNPAPSPAKEPKHVMNTGMQIVPDSKTYGARLQISQDTLNQLREAMNAGTSSQSFTGRITSSSTNTIIAGLFMFLSVSFAGVWLARSGNISNRNQKAAAVLLGFVMLGAAAIITRANAGPPPSYLWRNLSKNLTAGKPTNGGVDIEIVPDGVGVKLIVPTRDAGRNTDD